VLAVVIKRPYRLVGPIPSGRGGGGRQRRAASRASLGGAGRVRQQGFRPGSQPVLNHQVVRLETVVAGGVDQGEALVRARLQRRAARRGGRGQGRPRGGPGDGALAGGRRGQQRRRQPASARRPPGPRTPPPVRG